jgi:galacturonosyltransferase
MILTNNSGGLYRFRKELIGQLIRDGHEVYVMTPFDSYLEELQALGVHLIEQEMNRRGTNPLQELSLLVSYRRAIRSIHPDYIITYTIKPGIYGGLLAQNMHIPYAVNITGLGTAFQRQGLFQTLISWLWRRALRSAQCVFFENQENAQIFTEHKIIPAKRVHVLHGAGVNLTDFPFAEYPEGDGQIRFLFIGRVMREKGMDELLYAIERLHQQYANVTLDVLGMFEENYEGKLNELQQQGVIQYHGHQNDVQAFLQRAHAFVLPSYHEGMANTLLEAGAMGRPLITSNIHGCKEAVIDGETGFLCEAQNAASLLRQMERFMTLSYEEKRQMGQRSHMHIKENFNKSDVVRETVKWLYQIR